ncbi:hypothetical protein [Nakamurella lactea]|uniref:hypothetical protein n=1 Tax=Nakamurella lactea TaxID=459515 RepID=UPI0003F5F65D|nr:hypothetical protein [Nakamurella lactea]
MYIAGRESWKISIDEPQVLRIALYLREVCALTPHTDPDIPPLDPPASAWPAWVRRPADPDLPELAPLERAAASVQWTRWWNHALDIGAPALRDLAPGFKQFRHLPELRALLVAHFPNALVWTTAFGDDPRVKRDILAPGTRLTELVNDVERSAGRAAKPFELRITVISVQTKHAWVLGPGHLLITHRLIHDDENMLDWLRPQLRELV